MKPIIYHKDGRYDYNYYDCCYDFYNDGLENRNVFDEYQLGYNHLGYEKLILINIVYNGTEMEYFFIDEDNEMFSFTGDDAQYITSGKAGYRLTKNTQEETAVINHLSQLIENRRQYEIDIQDEPVNIKKFKFLK